MKNLFLKSVFSIFIIFSLTSNTYSQSINQTLSSLSTDAAVKYTDPAVTAFRASLNSGWFSELPSPTNGIHVKLRFVAVGSMFSNNVRRFSTQGQFRFSSKQAGEILEESNYFPGDLYYDEMKSYIINKSWDVHIEGPTIIGSNNEYLMVEFPGDEIPVEVAGTTQYFTVDSYSVSEEEVKGFLNNLEFLPTPAVQLDLSSIYGTGISFRFFKGVNIENLGEINIWGIGLVHNIRYWLPESFPLNLGAAFYFQKFDLGTVFQNTASKFGLYFSKDIGSFITFSPYAGISYESSQSHIRYNYKFDTPTGSQDVNIVVNFDQLSTVAITLGAAVKFPVVSLNIDYKFAETATLALGLGFGF